MVRLVSCIACWVTLAASVPPLYNITAHTLYDAGVQHGHLAAPRIQAWLASDEIQGIWNFSQYDLQGRAAYSALRRDSSTAYPVYAEELRGIAQGAQVDLDKLWAATLMIEMENLMSMKDAAEHCSDLFAISAGGCKEGFAQGHNEDWGPTVGNLYYYVKYTPSGPNSDFERCAGLAYPGALIGWAPTWNAHGMFMTVNTLYPKKIRTNGITTAFVQREAMCGMGRGVDLDSVIGGLENPHWAEGASLNLVDIQQKRMANVEVHESDHNVFEVTENRGNYSHFNAYKRLYPGAIDGPQPSSEDRQALADTWPAPRSRDDIADMLSDRTSINGSTPIFRDITIATLVIDGISGNLDVWCCGKSASTGLQETVHRWNLKEFFMSPEEIASVVIVS